MFLNYCKAKKKKKKIRKFHPLKVIVISSEYA